MRSLALLAFGAVLLLPAVAAAQPTGEALFAQNCSACHQASGKGIPGAFPALAGDAFVQGPSPPVATLLMNGRGGMPTFRAELTDAEIAAILTYVRGAWGNHAGPVTPAVVAAARAAHGPPAPARGLQSH